MVHLSRLGEEIVLWTTDEFGFMRLADAYATGSSMLPQKKNPDIAELARGKAGRVIGNLTGLLATLKGLPLAYNRDLQEDKEPLFDTLDTVRLALVALTGLLATAEFDADAMPAAADSPTVAATDLAEWLVARGMPFREAHAVVGAVVRQSVERGVPLDELVMTEPRLGPDALAAARTRSGGAAPVDAGRRRPRAVPGPQLAAARASAPRAARPTDAPTNDAWPHARPRLLRPRRAHSRAGAPQQGARARRPEPRAARDAHRRGRGVPRRATIPRATRTAARPRATPRCSGRPATSTCTSRTGCTGAPTSSPVPRAPRDAVLLRAGAPVDGIDAMRARRPTRAGTATSAPARPA